MKSKRRSKKLTIRKFKWELQSKIEVTPSGEKHKYFDYPIFSNLPSEWKIHKNTPLEIQETQTAICFAGDLQRNFFDVYILKKIDWENYYVYCSPIYNKSRFSCFYIDSVALIPLEILSSKIRLELLKPDSLKREIQYQRNRRKQFQNGEMNARST